MSRYLTIALLAVILVLAGFISCKPTVPPISAKATIEQLMAALKADDYPGACSALNSGQRLDRVESFKLFSRPDDLKALIERNHYQPQSWNLQTQSVNDELENTPLYDIIKGPVVFRDGARGTFWIKAAAETVGEPSGRMWIFKEIRFTRDGEVEK